MFRFDQEKILSAFLRTRWTTYELARRAGCGYRATYRAVNGKLVSASVVAKIAAALGLDAVSYLAAED